MKKYEVLVSWTSSKYVDVIAENEEEIEGIICNNMDEILGFSEDNYDGDSEEIVDYREVCEVSEEDYDEGIL